MTGTIKSYNDSTRYGFITSDDVDYRFHRNDWKSLMPPVEGMNVEFLEVRTDKGMRATDVSNI